MSVEFATMIDDYDFSYLSMKALNTIKERVASTLLFERVSAIRHKRPGQIYAMQYHWNLI